MNRAEINKEVSDIDGIGWFKNEAITVMRLLSREESPDISVALIILNGVNDRVRNKTVAATYMVLDGKVTFDVENAGNHETRELIAGQHIHIPAGTPYQDKGQAIMLNTCHGAFNPEEVELLGPTTTDVKEELSPLVLELIKKNVLPGGVGFLIYKSIEYIYPERFTETDTLEHDVPSGEMNRIKDLIRQLYKNGGWNEMYNSLAEVNTEILKINIRKEIIGDTIRLKEFSIDDASALFTLIDNNREYFSQYRETTPEHHKTLQDTINTIAHSPKSIMWYGIWNNQNTLIGDINIDRDPENYYQAEIGYSLGKEYSKNGNMTNAVRLLASTVFDETDVRAISAVIHPDHICSRGVMERIGAHQAGEVIRNGYTYVRYELTA